jgi:ribosomal protein S6--L-glutamate ligase
MKIAILSRNKKLYSTRRLKEAGEALGHQVDVLDTLHCYMDITSDRSVVRYKGKELPQYDAIIAYWRINFFLWHRCSPSI